MCELLEQLKTYLEDENVGLEDVLGTIAIGYGLLFHLSNFCTSYYERYKDDITYHFQRYQEISEEALDIHLIP